MKPPRCLVALGLALIALVATASAQPVLLTSGPARLATGRYLYFSANQPFLSQAYHPGNPASLVTSQGYRDGTRAAATIAAGDMVDSWIPFSAGDLTDGVLTAAGSVSGWQGQVGGSGGARPVHVLIDLGGYYALSDMNLRLYSNSSYRWNGTADIQEVWTATALSTAPGKGAALDAGTDYWTKGATFTAVATGESNVTLTLNRTARYVLLVLTAGTVDGSNAGGVLREVNIHGSPAAAETPATVGFYRYLNPPGQEPGTVDRSFATGMLTDGNLSTLASWPGNGNGDTAQPIVFDLRRDVPVQRVVLHSSFANQYWGIQSITVEVRASADECYQRAAFIDQPGSGWTQLSIPTQGLEGRYVRVILKRAHNYVYMGASEVQIFTPHSGAPFQAATDLSTEFASQTETLVTAGFYRYQAPPGQESTAGSVAISPTAKLTDGDTTAQVTWPGSSTALKSVSLVFDLQRDVPVQRVVVHAQFPNSSWTISSITAEVRPSAGAAYLNPVAVFPKDTNWTRLAVPTDGVIGRYVRVTFRRSNSSSSIGLAEVKIYTSPSTAPLLATTDMSGQFSRDTDTLTVDTYGQFLWDTWPGKIVNDAQLVADKNAEAAILPTAAPAGTDLYGGRIGSTTYGDPDDYFRVQKIDGRWWLISPEGNKFFLHALCSTRPLSWGYATAVYKNDGTTTRGVFQQLPSQGGAYNPSSGTGRRVSFPVANLIRKYGASYHAPWGSVMQRRMWDWGFNANGKWEAPTLTTLQIPFVENLKPGSGATRIAGAALDPFAPDFEASIAVNLPGPTSGKSTDKWMIGYFFDNEAGWDLTTLKEVMKLPATREAKIALVDHLFAYHTTSQLSVAFGLTITTKQHLLNATPSSWPSSFNVTGRSFIRNVAGPLYWEAVERICRGALPNHLFLGGALVPGWNSSFDWEVSSLPYVDVLSLDNYSKSTAWYSAPQTSEAPGAALGYAGIDKPVVLLEYGFAKAGRGHGLFANATCETDEERGLRFRHFVENLASHPNFVGASLFCLFDQAPTGRNEYNATTNGENYNFGLLNQQDQPYADMINEVRKLRFPRLHDVHEGTVAPFTLGN